MSKDIVAKRYAVALFQLAKEKHMLETFEEDLRTVKEVFLTNKDLHAFLELPSVTKENKKQMLSKAFASLSQPVLNTLYMLTDRHRLDIVAEMADAYFAKANEERNVADATVYSVRLLTEDEKAGIADVFANKLNKDAIRIKNIVDEDLLGGIKVRIGNRIYDGSLQGKITRIQRELLNNR
ncbi:F0F1 ATP synthase subunit delta [Bacillus sp. 165]|uniref:F0F1 ATP synthase subunit delta n=1 Tax=Bacillus sp. 165 TaxID=1529117 RepID=UPI001ADA72B7|nr:F0F1 ATP synthase subunit delta [Bacillus sp. 165]MBO9130064.1 F0F1 ATP synthase subunit delta [Bacillus sp. 165]